MPHAAVFIDAEAAGLPGRAHGRVAVFSVRCRMNDAHACLLRGQGQKRCGNIPALRAETGFARQIEGQAAIGDAVDDILILSLGFSGGRMQGVARTRINAQIDALAQQMGHDTVRADDIAGLLPGKGAAENHHDGAVMMRSGPVVIHGSGPPVLPASACRKEADMSCIWR